MAWSASCAFPVLLIAFSTGPPVRRTGAAVDGGTNCSVCHSTFAPANSDPRGSVAIAVGNYTPGAVQQIQVTVKHPDQMRWGFELTARVASDPTKPAGTLAPGDQVRVRCDTGGDAPCADGVTQFAEHNNAPVTEVGAGFTFNVSWTPPATNVGDVVFYAAGNAANGDKNLTGDRIYTTNKIISPASGCTLTGTPTITSVLNGASFKAGIAANALVSIFGSGFQTAGVKRAAIDADVTNNAYPSALSCAAVEIDGKRAPVMYVDSGQLNVQAPSGTSQGMVTVRVLLNPDTPGQVGGAVAMTPTAASSAALFTSDGTRAIAQFAGTSNLVAAATPATAGDIITFWATGLGATQPQIPAGMIDTGLAPLAQVPAVTIGGVPVATTDMFYAGLSPGSLSCLYQLNVRVPVGVPAGAAAVKVQIGSLSSPDGITIPIK
jgi:uncharacterized protein (TIGR03437 family)